MYSSNKPEEDCTSSGKQPNGRRICAFCHHELPFPFVTVWVEEAHQSTGVRFCSFNEMILYFLENDIEMPKPVYGLARGSFIEVSHLIRRLRRIVKR